MAKKKTKGSTVFVNGVESELIINDKIVDIGSLYYKEPFKMPKPIYEQPRTTDGSPMQVSTRKQQFYAIPQSTFINEYYPSGHAINNTDLEYWKDVCMLQETENENGEKIEEYVNYKLQRRSFGLQQVGVRQLLASITGYPINFQNTGLNTSEKEKEVLADMKQIWLDSNMENALYDLWESIMITGDGALYQYVSEDSENIEYRVFSKLKGDDLLPHYNEFGKMDYFARSYTNTYVDIRTNDEVSTEYIDIIDKRSYRTFRNEDGDLVQISSMPHSFPYVPVDYGRFDLAVWSLVQDNIDSFEYLMSMLSENNLRLAFQTLLVQTDGDFQMKKGLNGGSSILKLDKESKADFLGKTDVANTFGLELNTLYDAIMQGMGIVKPENRTSGDTPVGTSKLRYAPAIEVAQRHAKKLDGVLDGVVKRFKTLCGTLNRRKSTDFNTLKVNAKIDIYTVIDEESWNNMVIQSYINGLISRETATERLTIAANDELFRLDKDEAELKLRDAQNNGGI